MSKSHETSAMLPLAPLAQEELDDEQSQGAADSDVITLKDLTTTNVKEKLETTPSKTSTTHQQQQLQRPTTPTPARKLQAKRPANLTVNILPTSTNIEHNLTETPNESLSNHKSNATASGSASATTFPHEQYKSVKKLDIGFENVRFSTKVGIFKRENKDIVCGITGYFRSGELTGIVGPSGAGKSTLLNMLSGYTSFGYTGNFTVNGKPRDLKTFKPNVAFITQDTSLQPFLTVKEAMHFSVNLKVGSNLTQSEKKDRVYKIMHALGLYECRQTRTGNLSGGQKKRLAIALELVNNPPVLVLDEPTTGLDSSSSTQLITLLKKLALEGRTVICTIHQPSALTFRMFDHLYAIAEGECIFAGGTDNLVPFLAETELNCPESYNPADYLMEIATHDYGKQNPKLVSLMDNGRNNDYRQNRAARAAQLAAIKKVDQLMTTGVLTPVTAPIIATPLPNELINQTKAQPTLQQHHKQLSPIAEMSSNVWDSHGINSIPQVDKSSNCCKPKRKKSAIQLDPANLCKRENIYATPFFRQLNLLLLRTFLILWRDNSLTTMRFAIHLITGLLIGCIYYGIGNDAGNALNNFRYAFYTIMFIMYCAFSGILVKFPLEFPIVSREHFNRWYSLRAYYVAITLADIPIQIICTSLFIFPTYYMTGQPLEVLRFSLFFLIVFLTALVAQSIGLAVGAALSMQLGAILGPFFICPFLQFSGFFLQEKDAPIYLRWMFNISFLKYSLDGAMLSIFGYDRGRLDCKDMYCQYTRPKFFLKDLDMARANYEHAVIFMFGLFIFLRIIAFYIMSFRLRLFR